MRHREGTADDVEVYLQPPSRPRRIASVVYQRVPENIRHLLRPLVPKMLQPRDLDDADHPERLVTLPFLTGRVLEVGCGHRKTVEGSIAVDLVPGGQPGTTGNARGRQSEADVCASGTALPFRAGSFDVVLARHNLEHYVDVVDVLMRWHDMLRPHGKLVIVVPDEESYPGRTVDLDPTHYHAFTRSSLARLVELLGFEVVHTETAVRRWSFLLVASATG